jgi:UDP-N-acetyl-D-mannosaminuronate dehydrogenase
LCVSTHDPNDEYTPYVDGLFSLAQKISREAKNGSLVSIESTVPKGTSKKIFEILNHRLHVAHAPHRWYALEEDVHGVNQIRVIGGVSDCCLKIALQFYDSGNDVLEPTDNITSNKIYDTPKTNSLGIPMHAVSEIEIAELTKIIENADRYMQIAFSEDLYLYCQTNNVNFGELREALNTKWNVNILEPRDGVGGHCLPKDTKMFLQSSKSLKSKILMAAMEVDQDYRRFREMRSYRLVPPAINSS